MKTTNLFDVLSKRIEQAVQEHIIASRGAAEAALQRAFASGSGAMAKAPHASGPRNSGRRRPPAEIAALGEQVYRAVCAKPGETMAVLAVEIGMPARELQRPMMHLKANGRVRCVGQRHLTRYFPLAVANVRPA